jgi:5-methylcytosine-specific restriction endonuclease McrA
MGWRTKAAKRAYQRKWYAARRRAWFRGKSCAACDATSRLELDHINPATKESHRVWSWAHERRMAELSKCQVLCHDCHAEKTAQDGSSWRRA